MQREEQTKKVKVEEKAKTRKEETHKQQMKRTGKKHKTTENNRKERYR